MKTAISLESIYPFSLDVIEAVVDVNERQVGFGSYVAFLESVGIDGRVVDSVKNTGILDIKPREFDEDEVTVVHLSMANPLDPNNLFTVASLAALYPNRRFVAAANPSGFGYGHNSLKIDDLREVAKGDFKPAALHIAKYLLNDQIKPNRTVQIGGSFGADLVVASKALDEFEVPVMVIIEPASVVSRGILALKNAFASSEASLKEYVELNQSELFNQARKNSVRGNNYLLGLFRASNIAITLGIASGGFEGRLDSSLRDGQSKAHVVWGTSSELCIDTVTTGIVDKMQRRYGNDRVQRIRLQDQKHAAMNYLPLYSAVVAQSLGI